MNTTQANDTIEFKGRDSSDFWFSCVDYKVVWDRRLSMCDKMVFTVICTHVNIRTRECPLKVKTIADEAGCSVRSVQESLKALVKYGIIERAECFENGKQKASVYKIIGHRAPYYRDAHPAASADTGEFRGAGDAGAAKNTTAMGACPAPIVVPCTHRGAADDTPSLRESNIYEIKEKDTSPSERGTSSPMGMNFSQKTSFQQNPEQRDSPNPPRMPDSPKEFCLPAKEIPPKVTDDLITPDEAPPAMREALDYFLLKTGRTGIEPEELSALRALEEIHTPARVNKEIAQAVERFGRNGKLLSSLTLIYIYKSLQYQNSLKHTQGKSPPQKAESGEDMPDPYEGCYL
jgi:DNA-binding Lrp family transcriptional regulator